MRPTIFDTKYQDLPTNEIFRQVQRDGMLYDLAHNKSNENSNTEQTNTVHVDTVDDYYDDIDTLIEEDEENEDVLSDEVEHLNKKDKLKRQYAEIRFERDKYAKNLGSMLDINAVAFFTIIFDIFLIPLSMGENDGNVPLIITLSISIILLSSLYRSHRKNYYNRKIDELDSQLKSLRRKIKSRK